MMLCGREVGSNCLLEILFALRTGVSELKFEYRKQDEMFVDWSKRISSDNYGAEFVRDELSVLKRDNLRGLDVGGGIGAFAKTVTDSVPNSFVEVVDLSPLARDNFVNSPNTEFVFDDFLARDFNEQYDFVFVRLLLHHLVSDSFSSSLAAQATALKKVASLVRPGGRIFIIENLYEPKIFTDVTGKIIYQLTKLQSLRSLIFRLGANTAGEGVLFHSEEIWYNLFESAGLGVISSRRSLSWGKNMPLWQRILLLCKHRFQCIYMLEVID